jgi:hypothetical protein
MRVLADADTGIIGACAPHPRTAIASFDDSKGPQVAVLRASIGEDQAGRAESAARSTSSTTSPGVSASTTIDTCAVR